MLLRAAVNLTVKIQNIAARRDLLNPALTQDHLIKLLARAVFPYPFGRGFHLVLTSINSDHHDDSALGPHSHHAGFAVDVWPVHEQDMKSFLQDMATHNRWVTKIGLGGSSQQFMDTIDWGSTIVFNDNNTDHVHLQTA